MPHDKTQDGKKTETSGEIAILQTENRDSSTSPAAIANGRADIGPAGNGPTGNGPAGNGRGSRSQPYASTALQDMFLNGLRRENIDVVVYFTDGTQERGVVRAFDTFTLLLENRGSGKAQLIYKHAVARIFPVRTPSLALDRVSRQRES